MKGIPQGRYTREFRQEAEIVGYTMGERMTKNLVSQSLLQAVNTREPEEGLLHRSDRGSQYCSLEYQGLLNHF